MDFIETASQSPMWPFGVCAFLGLLMIGMGVSAIVEERNWEKGKLTKIWLSLSTLGLLLLTIGAFNGINLHINKQQAKDTRNSAIAQGITDTYGLTIKQEQISTNRSDWSKTADGLYTDARVNLNYPKVMPDGNFETFGSVSTKSLNESDELVENSVTLIWVDGEMRLYGQPEGEEIGAELPRVKQE